MRILTALFAATFLCSCQSVPGETQRPYTLVDLTDAFVLLHDSTTDLSADERVARFEADIVPLFPQFYGRARYPQMSDEDYAGRILRALDGFDDYRDEYLETAESFEQLLAPAYDAFAATFPEIGEIGDIHLLHSLGEMDGGTRTFGDTNYIIFGADVMTWAHPYDDEQAFFHHELFHVLHRRYFGECERIWCGLWAEGLAVHVAHELNPDASDAQLLLTIPEPIREAVDANLAEAACAVRARLESDDDDDISALFSFERLNERLPPRFGYYVGFLVAQEAGRTRSLQELSRLDHAEARAAVDAALSVMADCATG